MKQHLVTYADSIDEMGLRERAMFFGAVALVIMTLLQVFLLSPVQSRRNQLSAQIAQQEDETKAMQAQIEALVRPSAPDQDALNRDRLKGLREEMAQVERRFEEQQKQFVAPEKMLSLLANMVGKNRQLQLVSLRNLPSVGLSTGAAPNSAAGAREVFRHPVELSVKGNYLDLLEYVAALEALPQRVFWDGFELSVAQYPQSVLKLTIYTLSPEKSWLAV